MEVYVFCIYNIFLLVNYIFISIVPKIVKVVKIVLSGSYLLEYSVAWCILGECEFSWHR